MQAFLGFTFDLANHIPFVNPSPPSSIAGSSSRSSARKASHDGYGVSPPCFFHVELGFAACLGFCVSSASLK